ncbi:hypothetical protein [Planococcus lenghuensis]|uniref:hypothetical protein n=1 Tax=Planococcus lenghuensis TaxID=2213202 RepID=UPI0012EBAFA2|nr:hypothetical protein [Planococcus lenghuensis]
MIAVVKAKWMKLGAAAVLSMNVLAACGDPGEQEEVDVPEVDDDEEVEEEVEEDPDAE